MDEDFLAPCIDERRRLVEKEGEWLERYVESFFKLSGFGTRRGLRVNMDAKNLPDVTHEFDVVASLPGLGAPIYVECKDVGFFKKELVDVFVGKLTDVDYSAAVLVTSNQAHSELEKYRNYCSRKGIAFFDGNEIDVFLNGLAGVGDLVGRQAFIVERLGARVSEKKRGFFWRFFGWLRR